METKPCPNCGAPKHPLKTCPQCGLSNLRREAKERLTTEQEEDSKEPEVTKYASGFLGRKRVKSKPRYDVWDDVGEIEPYQGPFFEDLPAYDTPPIPLTPTTTPHRWPELPGEYRPSFDPPTSLRPATRSQKAFLLLVEKPAAQLPMNKVLDVQVFDGWPCPSTTNFAKKLIQTNPTASLRDVQLEIIERVSQATLPHPHLWRIRVGISHSKQLFKDAQGRLYVSVDEVWRLAHSLRHLGGLVGAKSILKTREATVPQQGYFICWETESEARQHYLKKHFG